MTIASTRGQPKGWRAPVLLGLILAVSIALRFVSLARAPLWWDEGNNAYFAHVSLAKLLEMSRATLDTNPPAHRLVLKIWLWLWGEGAWQLRALSAVCGVLGVWLTYTWANWLYGRKVGLTAAALVSVWPALVYYGREAKPYTMITLCLGLSVYLWQRYLDRAPRLRPGPWLGAALCSALALGAHYYAALFIMAQGLGLLTALLVGHSSWPEARRRLGRWVAVHVPAGLLVAPWAALTHQTALSGASGLPEVGTQQSPLSYLHKLASGLMAGPTTSDNGMSAIAMASVALALLAMTIAVMEKRREPQTWLLSMLVWGSLALGFLAQQLVPFFQARFLLYIIPPLAILMAAGIVNMGWKGAMLAAGLALAWGLAMPAALTASHRTQDDLRPIVETVAQHARPGDAIIVGYIWQEGIMRMRAPELPVTYYLGWYADENVESELVALFKNHQRLWLLDYETDRQNPENAVGWWLESQAARVLSTDAPPYALALYTNPNPESQCEQVDISTGVDGPLATFEGGVTLLSANVPESVDPGRVLSLTLTWITTAADVPPWVVFVHLVDESGKLWTQSDGPPEGWLQSFAEVGLGEALESERAMLVPLDAPPGEYHVLVGLYDVTTGRRASVLNGASTSGDHVVIASVRIAEPN